MSHHIIDIEAISTLPGEVLTTQVKCSRHPDFIKDFFCNQHHVICCRNCMSEQHRSCDKFMPLEMASKNAKTSSLLHDMQRASSQSKHHLVAGTFSSLLEHGSQLVLEDIPKV
jgi:hypothetical protein